MDARISFFTANGSHYNVAKQVGENFAREINDYFNQHASLDPVFVPWSRTEEGKSILHDYLQVANKSFPQYVKEIQGLADGAKVDFMRVLLMNLRTEVGALLDEKKDAESCSDIIVNRPTVNCAISCHNEDGSPAAGNRSYIISVHIDADLDLGTPSEDFTAFCYPGEIPGNAFGFNKYGLTFGVNALYPKLVLKGRTPRNFLTRSLFAATSADDVFKILENDGIGAAYAFSTNMGVTGVKPALYNIETAPDVNRSSSNTNVYRIEPHSTLETGNYFHVNLFRRIEMPQRPAHIISSQHRTARIEQLPQPTSVHEALAILGDTADQKYPIFRTPRPTDQSVTLCTCIFDLLKCTFTVYEGNPTSKSPLRVLPIPCLK